MKHVGRCEYELLVQVHRGKGVEALEDQVLSCMAVARLVCKVALVLPVRFSYPLYEALIPVEKGIGNAFCVEEVREDFRCWSRVRTRVPFFGSAPMLAPSPAGESLRG